MKDYGWPFRQRIIHGPDAPKQHYRKLIERGLSETDAANMSGYHPIDDLKAVMPDVLWYLLAGIVCLAVIEVAI